jgi:uncharacterized membrane protein SpoIIM required for sporulation
MVLDWLIEIHNAEKHPERMFLLAFVYSSIAAAFALWIFPKNADAVMMVLVVAAFMPLMLNLMKTEELRDEESKPFVGKHWPALKLFIFMFFGMVLSYTLWYAFLPTETATNLFGMQIDTITSRNVDVGAMMGLGTFLQILMNNLKVLFVGIVLAFMWGAGAIFILDWNATILGTLLGDGIRGALHHGSMALGAMKYLVHGIPEISAYFVGGLAGGIISIAVSRHKPGDKEFTGVLKDSLELILIAIVILVIAAALEVGVSPYIG